MRILIASDKFKGSLSATSVAETISGVLQESLPDVEFDLCPIADGGEGTTDAMITALGGERVSVETVDALGRNRTAEYGWCNAQAIMEMSQASGLALVNDTKPQPQLASTWGTGLMIKAAVERGAQRLLIGIGGSATNDGGLGMVAALGYRFLDEKGDVVPPVMQEVLRIARVVPNQKAFAPSSIPILVACDVDNPLLGEKGATQVYGSQKGVKDFEWFEKRLTHLADIVARDLRTDPRHVPGAGAAGGLGWALMAFCGAKLTNGFDLVAEQIGLEQRVAQADLVITGEGRLDAQTLHGKGPLGIAQMARRLGKPVVAFAGAVEDSSALKYHFNFTCAAKPADMELSVAISQAKELLAAAVKGKISEIALLLGC